MLVQGTDVLYRTLDSPFLNISQFTLGRRCGVVSDNVIAIGRCSIAILSQVDTLAERSFKAVLQLQVLSKIKIKMEADLVRDKLAFGILAFTDFTLDVVNPLEYA